MLVSIGSLLSEVCGELAEPRYHGFSWLAAPLHSPISTFGEVFISRRNLSGDELTIAAI